VSPQPRAATRGRPVRRLDSPLVATVARRGRFQVAEPLFHRATPVALDGRRASEGDLVLVGSGKRGARVLRTLGRPDVARDVLEGLMLDRGLRRSFPQKVELEALESAAESIGADGRADLRDLPTFTIDPPDSRDFDDAISARREDDRIRLWVHIADVTAYVRPGGVVDQEAARRATSVYVPGAVEPMLPEELSNKACSLRPGEDRLAVTVELELRGTDVLAVRFQRSLIRSDARLTYPQVDEVFEGRARAEEPWGEPLAAARAVAAALRERRDARGSLEVNSAEPVFEFDSEGRVTGVGHEPQTESHRVIEELMVLANERVAGYLSDARLPTLYRVHERPDPQSVEFMVEQLASLDVPTPSIPERMSPQQAADAAAEASHLVARYSERTGRGKRAFGSLVLRSLKQAYYTPLNLGHAGLASPRYCHFTSPIRRLPDIAVHRDVGQPANGRGEVAVAWTGQPRVAEIQWGVVGLLERAQHQRPEGALPAAGALGIARHQVRGLGGGVGSLLRAHALGDRRRGHIERGQLLDHELDRLGVGALVHAVERGEAGVGQIAGHALVGQDHELLDHPVGLGLRLVAHAGHAPLGVELEDRLGRVDLQRPARVATLA